MPITLVGLLALVLLSGCATSGSNTLKVIDAHTHTVFNGQPEDTSHLEMSEAEYFRELKEIGAVGAVAHSIPPEAIPYGNFPTDQDLRSRGIFHCVGLTAKVEAAAVDSKLKSGKFHCLKIYLGYVHQFAYDPSYEPAYGLAEKYDVPVVFHTGDTYSDKAMLKYSDPLTIDEVAVRHPKVRFVIAHCGNPWIESGAEVAYKNSNVYLDGSAFVIGDLDKLPSETVEQYVIKPLRWVFNYVDNPKKLMFGTDWPLAKMEPYFRAFKKAIPKEHWQAVFHDNAARVFKLPL